MKIRIFAISCFIFSQTNKTNANKWTDNIDDIKSWCKNKFYMEENVLNKQFGIPEDLDYL